MHQAVAVANVARCAERPSTRPTVQATLERHWSSEGFLSAEHEAARFAAGRAALTRFLERWPVPAGERVLAVEQPFSVRFGDDRVRGRYDAVRESTARTIITDYKSGDVRIRPGARTRAGCAAAPALRARLGSRARRAAARWSSTFWRAMWSAGCTPTEAARRRSRQGREAAAGHPRRAFDATPGFPACDWCPYRRICPAAA